VGKPARSLSFARLTPGAAPTYGAITLEQARTTAGEWRSMIAKGIDPAVIEAERRAAEACERAIRVKHSFANVAETFIADKLAQERRGKSAERDLRSIFVAAWGDRPIGKITKLDVLESINAKKRSAPHMARALFIIVARFFNWAIDQQVYGLTTSPCDRLSVAKIIGATPSRTRRLNDDELIAFRRASGRMKYPAGPAYRLLLLTGLRLNEAARMSWSEVHGDVAIIAASRMNAKPGKAREHLVPLSTQAQ
jgi:integrase